MDDLTLPESIEIPSAVADKIPAGMPEWLVFVIAGFALALIIYILIKLGDMIFKIVLAVITVVIIYLLISGRVDIPILTPFFDTIANVVAGWFQ